MLLEESALTIVN